MDETGQETAKKWQGSDVAAYTQRAIANPTLLTPIIEQAKKYPYDCIINDIEDGYNTHPQIFSQYDALLHSKLPVVLGQTLLWKTPQVSAYWQTLKPYFCCFVESAPRNSESVPAPSGTISTLREVFLRNHASPSRPLATRKPKSMAIWLFPQAQPSAKL